MRLWDRSTVAAIRRRCFCLLIAPILFLPISSQSAFAAESFEGPTFRKGMWRFVRTLDVIVHPNIKQRVLRQDITRCVDPTEAMKATFSSSPVGSCVSVKPEKESNKYTFAKRCDFMGPVSTVIIVDGEEGYSEFNRLIAGSKTDFVTARRIGDCQADDANNSVSPPVLSQ